MKETKNKYKIFMQICLLHYIMIFHQLQRICMLNWRMLISNELDMMREKVVVVSIKGLRKNIETIRIIASEPRIKLGIPKTYAVMLLALPQHQFLMQKLLVK